MFFDVMLESAHKLQFGDSHSKSIEGFDETSLAQQHKVSNVLPSLPSAHTYVPGALSSLKHIEPWPVQ